MKGELTGLRTVQKLGEEKLKYLHGAPKTHTGPL